MLELAEVDLLQASALGECIVTDRDCVRHIYGGYCRISCKCTVADRGNSVECEFSACSGSDEEQGSTVFADEVILTLGGSVDRITLIYGKVLDFRACKGVFAYICNGGTDIYGSEISTVVERAAGNNVCVHRYFLKR